MTRKATRGGKGSKHVRVLIRCDLSDQTSARDSAVHIDVAYLCGHVVLPLQTHTQRSHYNGVTEMIPKKGFHCVLAISRTMSLVSCTFV